MKEAVVAGTEMWACAYPTPRSVVETFRRRYLAERLPEAMVPAAVVILDRLPLTPNGKWIDGRRPSPQLRRFGRDRPRGPAAVSGGGGVGRGLGRRARRGTGRVRDNFFELGGHSLLATQVVAGPGPCSGSTSPSAPCSKPTVAGLAEAVEEALVGPGHGPAAAGAAGGEALSFAQQRLWFLDQLDPGNPFYNLPGAALGGVGGGGAGRGAGGDRGPPRGPAHHLRRPRRPTPQVIGPRRHRLGRGADRAGTPEARETGAAAAAGGELARPFDLARGRCCGRS